ncbi:MAG: hypothetical protein DA408_14170 [Bacteroidetes bacterium]|nr:MAG: hypothetical protein DA408_14170 [Bacteroidota bacterium]
MPNNGLIFLLLLLLGATAGTAQDLRIAVPAQAMPLENLIHTLEAKYGLLFSYKQEDIVALQVVPPRGARKLPAFLTTTLKGSGLVFEIVQEKYVLLSKPAVRRSTVPVPGQAEEITLCGQVRDLLTQAPLLGANIYLQQARQGTVTESDGSFTLRVNGNAKTDTLIISYVGYQEQRLAVRQLWQRPCSTILLDYYSFGEDFLIVKEYLTDGILSGDNGAYTQLQPAKTGTLPGQVAPDILHTIQFLPGVSSADGTPSGISVQGGTPDQNLVLWEGIPVYHTAHYFGMLSAFNPFFIDKVTVFAGGFGAEYGGRISSVIQLESVADASPSTQIGIGTNLIDGFLDGQLASRDQRLSAIFSLRHSTTGLWRSPTFKNITRRVQQGILVQNIDLNRLPPGIHISDDFNFFDTNLKLTYQLSKQDELTAAGYYAANDFSDNILDDKRMQTQADTFALANSGIKVAWRHQWQPRLSTTLEALHTDYHYDYGYSVLTPGQVNPDKIGRKNSSIQEQQLHLQADYLTHANHSLKVGYQLTNYKVAFGITTSSMDDDSGNRAFDSPLHVLYADFQTNSESRIGFQAGLRLSQYQLVQKQYLEPRFRLWYRPTDQLTLYLNTGKYNQYLSQLIQLKGDQASIETPVWGLTGSAEVPVLNANHLQLGAVYRKNTWLLHVQAYAKKVTGLTSLSSGFDQGLSNRYHLGDAHIRGLDILVKKRWNNYKSWLSYSFSQIDYHFPTFFDTDFAAAIDQPHALNWAHLWTFGNLECSLGWTISSGRPYSASSNFEVLPAPPNSPGPRETVRPLVHAFNSERLPAEHQLDASLVYQFTPSLLHLSSLRVGLSFYNIYHHRNIYNREIYIDNRPNRPSALAYNDKVNMGFTPNFILRLTW